MNFCRDLVGLCIKNVYGLFFNPKQEIAPSLRRLDEFNSFIGKLVQHPQAYGILGPIISFMEMSKDFMLAKKYFNLCVSPRIIIARERIIGLKRYIISSTITLEIACFECILLGNPDIMDGFCSKSCRDHHDHIVLTFADMLRMTREPVYGIIIDVPAGINKVNFLIDKFLLPRREWLIRKSFSRIAYSYQNTILFMVVSMFSNLRMIDIIDFILIYIIIYGSICIVLLILILVVAIVKLLISNILLSILMIGGIILCKAILFQY